MMMNTRARIPRSLFDILVLAGVLILIGCEQFETTVPTEGMADSTSLVNCIVGGAEDSDWAAYYLDGRTYFKVTIPVTGAITIHYWLDDGRCFALYLQIQSPVTVEIGLQTHDGGTVDRPGNVYVEYVEGGSFTVLSKNAVEEIHQNYVLYKRKDIDGMEHPWWLCGDAGFRGSGPSIVKPLILNGVIQVAEGLPAQRPELSPVPEPQACPAGTFRNNGNGTVTDCSTGKLWVQNPDSTMRNWNTAYTYCNTLTLAGGGWRLPRPSELKDELYNGGITCSSPGPFTNVQCAPPYWGTDTNDPPTYTTLPAVGFAWGVAFGNGIVGFTVKASNNYVWCVRG